jgi:transcriptional regulator with XRE-family HTH domain
MTMQRILSQLDSRRARLGMSKADLARRAGVSIPTTRRLLSGRVRRPRTDALTALAAALGVEVRVSGTPCVVETTTVPAFRETQARAKARRLARLVQGTMALEAAAVGADTLHEIEEENVHALLAGPARRLWGE